LQNGSVKDVVLFTSDLLFSIKQVVCNIDNPKI
jgi:hypothetical protein